MGLGLVSLLQVWVWVFSVSPVASLDVSERTSPSFPPRRPRVRLLEDVARPDVPQLRVGAERRDAGAVPGGQLRLQLQLQPHSVTVGDGPAPPPGASLSAPAAGAAAPPPPGTPVAAEPRAGRASPRAQGHVPDWSSASSTLWLSLSLLSFLGVGGGESMFYKNKTPNRSYSHLHEILWFWAPWKVAHTGWCPGRGGWGRGWAGPRPRPGGSAVLSRGGVCPET